MVIDGDYETLCIKWRHEMVVSIDLVDWRSVTPSCLVLDPIQRVFGHGIESVSYIAIEKKQKRQRVLNWKCILGLTLLLSCARDRSDDGPPHVNASCCFKMQITYDESDRRSLQMAIHIGAKRPHVNAIESVESIGRPHRNAPGLSTYSQQGAFEHLLQGP